MFYRYDVWLTDYAGQLLPEASVIGRRNQALNQAGQAIAI
jgi:hypothetical protein